MYTEYAILDKNSAREIDYLERVMRSLEDRCPPELIKEMDRIVYDSVAYYYGKNTADEINGRYTLNIERKGCVTLHVSVLRYDDDK